MRAKPLVILLMFFFAFPVLTQAFDKGIYITSTTAMNTQKMSHLIKEAKATGINTFVIDVYNRSSRYTKNIKLVRANGIKYVARVVLFPYGGTIKDVRSKATLEKRWRWAKYAVDLGASAIQLDYVRFKPSQRLSNNNVHEIHRVIKFFKNKLAGTHVKLQVDVFGITALGPSKRIGQDVGIFGKTIDAVCPMVYPSHFEPFRYYAKRPYKAVAKLVGGVKKQLRGQANVAIYPFIELYNYRYPLSRSARIKYIKDQIKAVKDANVNGFYVWNDQNDYAILFDVLKQLQH